MSSELVVRLTPRQLRLMNDALDLYEASHHARPGPMPQPGAEDYGYAYDSDLMERLRTKVWTAFEAGGIKP